MSVTASAIITLARKECGTVEKVSNDVKYNTWFYGKEVNDAKQGGDVYPWCMAFQSWLFNQKDSLDLIGGKSASCAKTISWFQKNKQWYTSPKVGDLVFFTYSHVGLVIKVNSDGSITTIEGNTSANDSGSQRNGGMVAIRTRSKSIKGYGRPKYKAETTKTTTTKKKTTYSGTFPTIPQKGYLGYGDLGGNVQKLQKFLIWYGFKITADGDFGSNTCAAVQKFQKEMQLHVDGQFGKKSLAKAKTVVR